MPLINHSMCVRERENVDTCAFICCVHGFHTNLFFFLHLSSPRGAVEFKKAFKVLSHLHMTQVLSFNDKCVPKPPHSPGPAVSPFGVQVDLESGFWCQSTNQSKRFGFFYSPNNTNLLPCKLTVDQVTSDRNYRPISKANIQNQ